MIGVLVAIAFLLLLWVSLLYVPFRWRPVGLYLMIEKALAVAYAPLIVVLGAVLAVVGAILGSWWTIGPAVIAAVGALLVIVRIGAVRVEGIPPGGDILRKSWAGPLPGTHEPRVRRDVVFAHVPDRDRALLCDVWQPAADVPPSGVAIVYLFGSAYMILDKDCGTRPLFRQLTEQGHVVVDVAYRLFPETDIVGMVGDVKRAIAWVRCHATALGIDPARVVLVGGSAGGHLALLAAYGHDAPALTPPELAGSDLHVAAVAALYGQVGLDTLYEHTSQDTVCHPDDRQPDWTALPSRALVRVFGDNAARLRLQFMPYAGRCDWLVGGTPAQVPERYEQVSVFTYITPDCPRTLLVHGTHDEMAPVAAMRALERRLQEVGVPVTAVYLPHTDHGFDVVGTRWSPAARVSIHTLERFLAGKPRASITA